MSRHWNFWLFLAALLVLVYLTLGESLGLRPAPAPDFLQKPEDLKGVQFQSLAEADALMAQLGFQRIGRFGERWPATVEVIVRGREMLSFHHGTQPHRYTMRPDAELVALLMNREAQPVTLVYQRLGEPR